MAITIDLYHCELDDLKEHIQDPTVSEETLENYVKEMLKLIDQQKIDDKESASAPQTKDVSPSSPRSRGRARRKASEASLADIDAISVASSTTSSRPRRTTRGSRRTKNEPSQRRTRKHSSRSNKMDEDSEDDIDGEVTTVNPSRNGSVEYEWMEGIDLTNEDKSDSSSDDILLHFNPKDIQNDDRDIELILSDKNSETKKKSKKKKKKHKKDKKSKKHKKKKKKKKKKGKTETDDDYMISSDEEDLEPFDSKAFERKIQHWTNDKLEKELKSLERQIEEEKIKCNNHSKRKKSKSPADEDDDEEDDPSSADEDLNNLTVEQIQQKFNHKLHEFQHGKKLNPDQTISEDPTKIYCICKKPYDYVTPMIECDYCREWYHLNCIGLSQEQVREVEALKFKCPICNGADKNDLINMTSTAPTKSTFGSPRTTPNPPHHINGGSVTLNANGLKPRRNRRFIADSASDTDGGGGVRGNHPMIGHSEAVLNKEKVLKMNQRNEKYEKIIIELQNRLKQNKEIRKKQDKEMNERLSKAKHDIDLERKRRIEVEQHMDEAREKSQKMMSELAETIKTHQQMEVDYVNKLKKLEANKKKYKDSDRENKKKMKTLKEQHQARVSELENEVIPDLNDKLQNEKEKYVELQNRMQSNAQNQTNSMKEMQRQIQLHYTESIKYKQQLSIHSAETAKIQNINAQLQHKLDKLHETAQQNHTEWSNVSKRQDEKIKTLEKHVAALQQQNNALRSNNGMQPVNVINPSRNDSGVSTPRPPSPIKMPSTPAYLKFNELELEELKMCRELCQKLLETNLFQVEHMAARARLSTDLFVSWVTGNGKLPTVINDLNSANVSNMPQLNMNQHLSMNAIRMLLIDIRKQLETIQADQSGQHDSETLNKVGGLLREFQSASQAYEQKMGDFKAHQHNQLLRACREQGAALEMYGVTGTNEDGLPKSEWLPVKVITFEQQANRVLVQKVNNGDYAHVAIDAATLRLPEHDANGSTINVNINNNGIMNNNVNTNNNVNNSNNGTNNGSPAMMNGNQNNNTNNTAMSIPNMGAFNGQINFNGMPQIPSFHPSATNALPPFDQLQANTNISNQQLITNNNISINGAAHDPIIINDDNEDNTSRKSSSRKRKREERPSTASSSASKTNKKKKKSKHSKSHDSDQDSSASDSDTDESEVSSDSDTESESEKKSKKKKKKKHKKSKRKSKKSKKKKKDKLKDDAKSKRKRGRPKHDDNRSVSVASTSSTRKRRGTKRSLPNSAKSNGTNPNKKRKLDAGYIANNVQPVNGGLINGFLPHSATKNKSDYVVKGMSSSDPDDGNDSNCRICKHPGDLVCCEGCPSAYHADCIRPRVKPEWLDAFEEWYCPSCAPRFAYIPLKYKKNGEKWPMAKEPLLQDLKSFLKKHSYLERDYHPEFHPSRKNKV